MKNKAIFGAVLAVVALILLSLTLVTPWYNISGENESTDYYFDKVEYDGGEKDYNDGSKIDETFNRTRIFVIVAMIGSALGIVGAVMVAMAKMSPKIGVLILLIGFIFALIAPIYLMVSLPNAFEEDIYGGDDSNTPANSFFGSRNGIFWGGTTGWFLAIVASVLNIIALISVGITKSGPERTQEYYLQEARQSQQKSQQVQQQPEIKQQSQQVQQQPQMKQQSQQVQQQPTQQPPKRPTNQEEAMKDQQSQKRTHHHRRPEESPNFGGKKFAPDPSVERIEEELESLEEEESMIDTREVENALDENDLDRAEKALEELKKKYQEYKETIGKLESLDDRKTSLASQLAEKEIDRDTYEDAVKNIESEKARLEEKLNKLRKEVIYEDYEKPF